MNAPDSPRKQSYNFKYLNNTFHHIFFYINQDKQCAELEEK